MESFTTSFSRDSHGYPLPHGLPRQATTKAGARDLGNISRWASRVDPVWSLCHQHDLNCTKVDDAHMIPDDDANFHIAADAALNAVVLSKPNRSKKVKVSIEASKRKNASFVHCIGLFYVYGSLPGTTVLRLFATPSSLDSIVVSFDSRFVW